MKVIIMKFSKFCFDRCKRLNRLGLHPLVLSKAGSKALAVKARNWCDSASRFLKLCVDAGNVEACYSLGMVRTLPQISSFLMKFIWKLTLLLFVADPILLLAKQRKRGVVNGESSDQVPRASSLLARCYTIQRKRWLKKRQGSSCRSSPVRASRFPWSRGRAT